MTAFIAYPNNTGQVTSVVRSGSAFSYTDKFNAPGLCHAKVFLDSLADGRDGEERRVVEVGGAGERRNDLDDARRVVLVAREERQMGAGTVADEAERTWPYAILARA